jgi:hypothetical protein
MAGHRGIPVLPRANPAIREVGRAELRISPRCSRRHNESVTKRQAIVTQLVNRSATADFRAIKILLDILRDIERQSVPASPETAEFSEADQKVIEQIRSRFSRGEP